MDVILEALCEVGEAWLILGGIALYVIYMTIDKWLKEK